MMNALLAFAFVLAPAMAATAPRRIGYEREIDASHYNQVPTLQEFILTDDYVAAQKNRAKLITKLRPVEAVAADNVILESNVVKIVKPTKRRLAEESEPASLVRTRRGYNLENVQVPARYPYLPVPRFMRFRRWG